jgi:RNA polymerase sigma-70 factor (ECF subfamily)
METGTIELMAMARSGRVEALGELCSLYSNYMRMVARTGMGPKLRKRVEISDVVQEALIEVVRQFPQFTGHTEAALIGWMRRLVGQKLADLGRYHSRAKRGGGTTVPLDAGWYTGDGHDASDDAGGTKLLDVLAMDQTSPSETASHREQVALLADALAGLPDLESEVLWLRHVHNFSFAAIGERMGLSRKSVRGAWARGLKALRRALKEPPGGSLKHVDGGDSQEAEGAEPLPRGRSSRAALSDV